MGAYLKILPKPTHKCSKPTVPALTVPRAL